MEASPDYRYDPYAYEIEELARPDEMAMLNQLGNICVELLDTMKNANVLDLCCGTGLSMKYVIGHPNVEKIIGVDNCVEYLEYAKNKYKESPNIQFILEDAVGVDLPLKKWDIIILASAYHHIKDEEKVIFLKKAKHFLSDRGYIVLAENILPDYEEGNPF